MRLEEFIEINPPVKLLKGCSYPRIMMDEVHPGKRYVYSVDEQVFTGGGARFKNGDTLFARITPCLENGKIAQFKSKKGGVGFGSTEFFVFRGKEGTSDSDFVYYLSLTEVLRKPAEKSMFGASGRQRADLNVVRNIEIPNIPLPTQRKIAAILSAYDDLIENNTRRIKILEEMAQAIYREWFVHFRFPGHENVKMVDSGTELGMVPEGWEVKRLGQVCTITMGQSPKSEFYNENGDGLPFHQGVTNFGFLFPTDKVYCNIDGRLAEEGDILFSVRAPVGRINIATNKIVIGRGLCAIHNEIIPGFVYYQLKNTFKEEDLMGGGTIFKSVTKDDVLNIEFLLPANKILNDFEAIASSIIKLLEILTKKNSTLQKTRDLLLPRLVSGELDVSELDISLNNVRSG